MATPTTLLGVLAREGRVDLVVVLTVVADQQPLARRGTRRRAAAGWRACASLPLRNQRSCVGPPVGEEHRARREEVAAQEPDQRRRDVPGAGREVDDGRARVRRARAAPCSTAMPGTGWRACSSTTKEFHAARSGRGRAVTMTVSSTSETTPKRTSGPTTNTRVSTGSPPSTDIVEGLPARLERAPAARCRSRRRDRRRPRASTPADRDRHLREADRDGGEAAPAAHARVLAGRARLRRRDDEHSPEHAHPVHARRSRGTASPSGCWPARARTALAPGVEAVLQPGEPQHLGARGRRRSAGIRSVFHVVLDADAVVRRFARRPSRCLRSARSMTFLLDEDEDDEQRR